MSIWRSPVFYFGVVLALLVSLALAAPFVLNWNSYKPGLEAFGSRLTGRTVRIGGDVEIRLFPWPSLTADEVQISNPAGMDDGPLLKAQTIRLELALGSLLNGDLDVQSVDIVEPQLVLLRDGAGAVNWQLGPEAGIKSSTLLSKVKLDSIRVLNGTLRFRDGQHGGRFDVTTFDAEMSAAAIEGPWRIKGTGFWGDTPLALTFTSAVAKPGEPFRFGARVVPGDTAFPAVGLDGEWDGTLFDGSLRVDPQLGIDEKGSAPGNLKPLNFQSKISAASDHIELSQIRMAPADMRDSGTLIEGRANIRLGATYDALVELNAPRVNLDTLMGVEMSQTFRTENLASAARQMLRLAPGKLKADFLLDLGVVTYRGETLQEVSVKAGAEQGKLHIAQVRAGLPGRSAVLFTGDLVQKDGAPELSGQVDFESNDLRAFVRWAKPGSTAAIDTYWKGDRGRLKLISRIKWSDVQTQFLNTDFEFDGSPGKGELLLTHGALPALDLKLDIRDLNLDEHLPPGTADMGGGKAFDALGYVVPFLTGDTAGDKHVVIEAGSVVLNGVSAQDVALDFTASSSGLEIKLFDIGSVGGAKLKSQGLVLSTPDGPSGDITANLSAVDPRSFLQLLGLAQPSSRWLEALGQSAAALALNIRPSKEGPRIGYGFKGKTGGHSFDLAGQITALERAGDARLSLNGKVTSAEARQLLRLAGFNAPETLTGAGEANFTFTGNRSDGFAARFDGTAATVRVTFDGNLKPGEAFGGLAGTANIVASKAGDALSALGIAIPVAEGALQLSARLVAENGDLKATQIFGNLAQSSFKGEASMTATGTFAADMEAGRVALSDILAVALLPWDGKAPDLQRSFARGDEGVVGEFAIRPQQLVMPFGAALAETAVILSLGKSSRIELLAPTHPDTSFALVLEPKDGSFEAKLDGASQVDLAQLLKLVDGTEVATGLARLKVNLTATGRSPAALLSSLKGSGTYTLENATLTRFSPDELAVRIDAVTTANELAEGLKALEAPGGFALGAASGDISAEKGIVSFRPFKTKGSATETSTQVTADLVTGFVNQTMTVALLDRKDLPQVSIGYEGTPGAMVRRSATSALAAKLGHTLMAKDLKELERLRQEEERLAKREDDQRVADVEKFENYQAQRAELRLRNRELRVFAEMRDRQAKIAGEKFAAFLPLADAMNRTDLVKAKLQVAVVRKLAAVELRRQQQKAAAEEAFRKAREAEEKRKVEEQRKAEEAARKAEEARIAEVARIAEEARKAEEARIAEVARIAEEARKAEAARIAEVARIAEEARKAEAARVFEEMRKAEEARIAEEAREAEVARRAEEERKAEEEEAKAALAAELERIAEEQRQADAAAEEALRVEAERKAEEEAARIKAEELKAQEPQPLPDPGCIYC